MIIIFEGIDGVGKTTHLNMIYERLKKDLNKNIYKFRLPSDEVKNYIKQIVKNEIIYNKKEFKEKLIKDREKLLQKIIKIKEGNNAIILLDRGSLLSTYAYQKQMGFSDEEVFEVVENYYIKPDIIFYLKSFNKRGDEIYKSYELFQIEQNYEHFFENYYFTETFLYYIEIDKNKSIKENNDEIYNYIMTELKTKSFINDCITCNLSYKDYVIKKELIIRE